MNQIEAERVQDAYRANKSELTQKEKEIITRYYGINPHVRHTLEEIGEMYQVTRERIRQIKVEALKKIGVQLEPSKWARPKAKKRKK